MRDRRDIRARREGGGTIRGIAREIGADRNSIRRGGRPGRPVRRSTTCAPRWRTSTSSPCATFSPTSSHQRDAGSRDHRGSGIPPRLLTWPDSALSRLSDPSRLWLNRSSVLFASV